MLKISCITPSIRPEMLEIVERCLSRQTLQSYQWIVVSPKNYKFGEWVQDPPRKEGDFYGLNKAWNAGLKRAEGKLFVSIVDGLWFPPYLLERLWQYYERDPMSCIGGVGHQYSRIENNKPEGLVWQDPRVRSDTTFWEISPIDMEWCIASIPMKAIQNVGGIDANIYDKVAALSEKEINVRMSKLGYKFYLDSTIEYRAIKHERLNSEWDKKYEEGCKIFNQHLKEIEAGKRLKLDYL